MSARSNSWVWGHSLAGIAGSNPAGDMDVCLLWILHVQVEGSATGRADPSSGGVLPNVCECDETQK